MKLLRYLIPLYTVLGFFNLFAAQDEKVQDGSAYDIELNERDWAALREFLNTKRDIPTKEKATHLAISGDVRFEYRHMTEDFRGIYLRGNNALDPWGEVPISKNDFDCEFNLKFDYIMDKTWAVAHMQYDNSAGVSSEEYNCKEDCQGWFGSGRCDKLCLRKAYMGYNVWSYPCHRFDVELGRRGNLYHVFDSRIQFLSRFDGILLKWSGNWECVSEWFIKFGGLVVDERVTHLAYVTEVGFLNIMDTGFDVKYSFIDWWKPGNGRCLRKPLCTFRGKFVRDPDAFKYQISQFTLAYNFDPELFCRPAKLYGAVLFNHKLHKAKYLRPNVPFSTELSADEIAAGFNLVIPDVVTYHKTRANLGWYAGFMIGEVTKEGDWAIDIQYQEVGAVAVPGQDMSGIGTGNVLDFTLTRDYMDNTNFRGWKVEGLYALTDNITIDTIVEASRPLKSRIGGSRSYSKLEVEAIYAF